MRHPLFRRTRRSGPLVAAAIAVLAGCSSDSTAPRSPTTGSIAVTTATTGTDPDGSYTILVDGTNKGAITGNGSVTVSGIAAGARTVTLDAIDANCSATGSGASQTVTVTAGETTTAAFAVSCVPNLGTLIVTVLTSGVELDPDGYTVRVGSGSAEAVGLNDTITLAGVAAEAVSVTLGDLALTCDPSTGTRSVEGAVTVDAVVPFGGTATASFTITCTRKDVLFVRAPGQSNAYHQIFRMNGDGSGPVQITSGTGEWFWNPRWSPDGSKIAFASDLPGNANIEIYVMNADGTGRTLLCCGGADSSFGGPIWDENPTWSPDGSKIAWGATRPDTLQRGIWTMNADGTGRVQLTAGDDHAPDWGPDGRIVFARWRSASAPAYDLYLMDADGGNVTLLRQDGDQQGPRWSPDGSTIAYHRLDPATDRYKIWTIPSGGGTPTLRVGETVELEPAWSPDGTSLIFWYQAGAAGSATPHGICTAPAAGGTCTRLTSQATTNWFDTSPDWR
jgi:Tol biopolymer transport system component